MYPSIYILAATHTDKVYWNEIRPDEGGRYVICSSDAEGNHVEQWTQREFNARTIVHEYGGEDADSFIFITIDFCIVLSILLLTSENNGCC